MKQIQHRGHAALPVFDTGAVLVAGPLAWLQLVRREGHHRQPAPHRQRVPPTEQAADVGAEEVIQTPRKVVRHPQLQPRIAVGRRPLELAAPGRRQLHHAFRVEQHVVDQIADGAGADLDRPDLRARVEDREDVLFHEGADFARPPGRDQPARSGGQHGERRAYDPPPA